ncbi:MAG: PAS domain S-box protein [Proteobacteria bacterium]|nr:PAS domain S-box protein [Pseudomonadota bacterium]
MDSSLYKTLFEQVTQALACVKIIGDECGQACDYEFLNINSAFEKMAGLNASNVIGKTYRSVYPDSAEELAKQLNVFEEVTLNGGHRQCDQILNDGAQILRLDVSSFAKDCFLICHTDISEQQKYKKANEEKDLERQMFFDLSPNLLCVFGLEGDLIKYNASWNNTLGYDEQDLIGKKYQEKINPDDYQSVMDMFKSLNSRTSIEKFTTRFRDAAGEYKSFEWNAHVQGDYLFATAQDITRSINADSLLRESDEKFRQIFVHSPLGLIYFNKDGVITECNDSFVKIIGSSHEKLVGLDMFKLPDERVRQALNSSLEDLETTVLEIDYISYTALKKTPIRLLFTPIISSECSSIGGIGIVEDITERVNSEKALRESKNKYQTLFEQAAEGVLIGIDGGIIDDANQGMSTISGFEKEELVGKNISMLFSEKVLNEKPLDYASVIGGDIVYAERNLTRKDGRDLIVEMKTKRLGDGRLFSSIRDVTQLKKAEEALKESEDRLKRFFDLNPYSIMITSSEGNPLHINQAFLNLFGSFPSKDFNIFHDPIARRLGIVDDMKKTLLGETIRIPDFCYSAKSSDSQMNDKTLWIRMVMFPLTNMQGQVEMLILMHEDITEQYILKEKLRHSEKMEAIGLLTGGIAHDFNNMLSGIIGGATLLKKYTITDEARRFLKLITDSAERMTDLTGKLLSFGRKDERDFKPENIHTAINNAIEILRYTIDKRIEISCFFESDILIVKGNISQLQNVFINLGINASHAMPHGGSISFRTAVVDLDATNLKTVPYKLIPGKYVKIEVRDTGTGIPVKYKNKIFEPFFTTKKLNEGAGLGLTTAYGTVKDHKGMIDFASELNIGSVFLIYLPFVGSHMALPEHDTAHVQSSGSGTVLLVEDEEIVRDATQDMLEALGYHVITAENGQEGLDKFLAEKNRIDLVILDMMMPKMNGKECFKGIKNSAPNAKIILYSGYYSIDDVSELKEEGLCAFIKKPFSFAELGKVIKACVDQR